MTPLQAKYDKKIRDEFYSGDKEIKITAYKKLSQLINSDWNYSWHWKDDNDEWVSQAKRDAEKELVFHKNRVKDLEQAKRILNEIDVE